MTVRGKIVTLVFSCIIFLSFFFLFWLRQSVKVVLEENLSRETNYTREMLWSLLRGELGRMGVAVADYAQWTDMGEKGVKERNTAWLRENLNPWVKEQFGYEVILVTGEKEVITASPGWVMPCTDLSEEAWGGVYGDGKNLWMVVSHPVVDNSGEQFYNAWVCFAKVVDGALLEQWSKMLGGKIFYRPSGKAIRGEPALGIEPKSSYRRGMLQIAVELLDGEGEVLGEFSIEKEYTGPFRVYATVWRVFLLSVSVVVLFSFLVTWVAVKRILFPLERLRDSVTRISQGNYNLELEVDRKDEIGELSLGFARMAEALQKREEDLGMEKRKAERLANLDSLTHVPNRRFLERSVERLIQEGRQFALVFLDLDGFKRVNDLLGHTEGDRLLRRMALWFEKNIRKEDIVARYGGDEFCFLFPGLTREEAEDVVERLSLRFLEKDFAGSLSLGFSYGVAVYPDEAMNLDGLLSRSDGEMYARKRRRLLTDR
ncbi:MAG: diguanylate cyclase [Candidatus Atribacteria bacterium]|nr:diguanylate cyclase [Candidatus Atribacteria bacterium]